MSRDRRRDNVFFNCKQEHEHYYVASLYNNHYEEVRKFLEEKCRLNKIVYWTHQKVYRLIEEELGYPVPN